MNNLQGKVDNIDNLQGKVDNINNWVITYENDTLQFSEVE